MNKLIILSALFLMSCAHNTGYRKHDLYSVKYTVREYYMPVTVKPETKPIKKPSKSVKKKKAIRLDCKRVFQEINRCSI